MRKLRVDRSGISEIVGALMLTLIVVVAASSFAVFLSQQQKAVQDQELYALEKSQESLNIIGFQQNFTTNNKEYFDLNFTITSNHARDSDVTKIAVNGHVARDFFLWRINQTSGIWEQEHLDWSNDFKILAKEQLYLRLNKTNLFENNVIFQNGTFVKLEVFTKLLNSFTRVYMPPSALLTISTESLWDGVSFKPFIVLDGGGSVAQEGSYLTMYDWNVTKPGVSPSYSHVGGVKATFDFSSLGPGQYYVNLTVMDDHGLMGIDSTIYFLI